VRERRALRLAISVGLALLLLGVTSPRSEAATPTLPVEMGRLFLSSLSVSAAQPGTSVELGFELGNPLPYALANVSLTFAFYSFNPYPGTGATSIPPSSPALVSGSSSGPAVAIAVGSLAGHESNWTTPVRILVPDGAPQGTYAVRDTLTFDLNDSRYVLESIGNFPASEWQSANVLANGTPTVNLSRLGVSGVLPETAVIVNDPVPLDLALYAVLGGAVVLALAGAYVGLRRRGPGSRSGTRPAPDESHAPTALGKSRNRDGD
jgi:hypothetical protein